MRFRFADSNFSCKYSLVRFLTSIDDACKYTPSINILTGLRSNDAHGTFKDKDLSEPKSTFTGKSKSANAELLSFKSLSSNLPLHAPYTININLIYNFGFYL